MEPTFSTLEVDRRGPHSTLEVDPRQYPSGLEVKPADVHVSNGLLEGLQRSSGGREVKPQGEPWYKRHWLAILVINIIITRDIINSTISRTLASNKDPKKTERTEEAVAGPRQGRPASNP